MLFDVDLTSLSDLITCFKVNIKFMNTRVLFRGQRCSTCASQNWVYRSVRLFDATANDLHDLSPLYLNQRMLILLVQLSK